MLKQLGLTGAAILLGSASQVLAQMGAPSIISSLPDVSSISPANAAGVLQYCEKHDLVSSAVTDPILGALTTDKGVATSSDFTAGQAGQILAGGKKFSLPTASSYLRSQSCDMVLKQAGHFK
jgi:hypothetical protein